MSDTVLSTMKLPKMPSWFWGPCTKMTGMKLEENVVRSI